MVVIVTIMIKISRDIAGTIALVSGITMVRKLMAFLLVTCIH